MADDFDIKVEDLPENVRNTAKKFLPQTNWHGAVKVQEGGKTAYELDGTTEVTVTITAEGKIMECDEKIAEPPARILKAVRKKWPRFEVVESHLLRLGEELKRPDDGDLAYELRGTRANEKNVHGQVSAEGELLEWSNEIRLDKVPEPVSKALERKHPKFKPDTVYEICEKGDKNAIGYKYEGTGPKGRERSFYVTADGKSVELVEEQD